MNAAGQWQRVQELFDEAFALPPADRRDWLAAQTVDIAVRREVESLLRFSQGADRTLVDFRKAVDGAVAGLPHTDNGGSVEPIEAFPPGSRIGQYRVLHLIGEGGMGAVYKAVREDHFHKEVAIKVVKRGMDTDSILARFIQERQMLAGLEHVNIARLLDGNITEDGRPYLVMEYVDGEPLMEWRRRPHVTVRQKLDMFLHVCAAVQYAHGKLIVHRDIKSGNILVTPDGTAKLLDFGIAKWLDSANQADVTAGMPPLLTPDYASPEQLLGQPVTTATDVYSLGVVLYELLAGARPWKRSTMDRTSIEEITTKSPPRPSSLAKQSDVRTVRGDLDNIVMTALRPEPERRYSSVEQFAEDIRLFLAGRPVRAHQDSLLYRSGKFLRRNRIGVAAMLLVAAAATAGFYATLRAKQTAERRFQDVRALANTFLFDFYDQIRDVEGATQAREMVVGTALRYLDRLQKEAGSDHDLLAELAAAYDRVATAQGDPHGASLGHRKAARDSFLKAVGLWDRAIAANPSSRQARMGLAGSLNALGNLQIALGDLPSAEAVQNRCSALMKTLRAERPDDVQARVVEAQSEAHLGNLTTAQGKVQDTIQHFERARDGYRAALQMKSNFSVQRDLAGVLSSLSSAEARAGELEKAVKDARDGVSLAEQLYAANPQSSSARRNVYVTHQLLGNILGAQGRPSLDDIPGARAAYEKSLEIAQLAVQADPKNQSGMNDLMLAWGKLGDLLEEADPPRSLDYNAKAFALAQQLVKDGMDRQDIQGYYWLSTARPLELTGHREEALGRLRSVIALLEKRTQDPANSPVSFRQNLAEAWVELGSMEGRAKAFPEARRHLDTGLRLYQAILQAEPRILRYRKDVAETLAARAQMESTAGERNAAFELQQRAVGIWREWNQLTPGNPYGKRREAQAARTLLSSR